MDRKLEMPSWLTNALGSIVAPIRGTISKRQAPEAGDIYVVTPGRLGTGTNRLCAVLESDSSMEAARVALITNEIEYACDWDVRMSRDELQLPYELMMACDIVSSVWWTQLSRRVGTVPNHIWSGLSLAANTGDFVEVNESRRGTPIHGPIDPRWTFREEELSALQALSTECMSRLIDGLILDPALIWALAEANREEQVSIAAAISERATTEIVTMDPGSLNLLLSPSASLDPDAWAALQRIIESASGADNVKSSDLSLLNTSSLATLSRARCKSGIKEAFDSLLTSVVRGSGPISHVLTRNEVWPADCAVLHIDSSNATPIILIAEMLR